MSQKISIFTLDRYFQGELWLGLRKLHQLTSGGDYGLNVTLTDFQGKSYTAVYNRFQVRTLLKMKTWLNSSCRSALAAVMYSVWGDLTPTPPPWGTRWLTPRGSSPMMGWSSVLSKNVTYKMTVDAPPPGIRTRIQLLSATTVLLEHLEADGFPHATYIIWLGNWQHHRHQKLSKSLGGGEEKADNAPSAGKKQTWNYSPNSFPLSKHEIIS